MKPLTHEQKERLGNVILGKARDLYPFFAVLAIGILCKLVLPHLAIEPILTKDFICEHINKMILFIESTYLIGVLFRIEMLSVGVICGWSESTTNRVADISFFIQIVLLAATLAVFFIMGFDLLIGAPIPRFFL